ncbi:MAG TPA: MurR/RpiR family transcriptional regulator [Anaerolineales bacterium]|nr:MurR/RpiR family transcriptional regulator [Anaerolineales bacterium]
MTYEERIREAYPSFSKSFARLADFLLDSYLEAAFMTATELGHAINVDATTVVRFSQQLGYGGYPELLREIREKIKSQLLAQPQKATDADSLEAVVATAMAELDSLFEQTRKLIDIDVVERLVDRIETAGKIFLLPDSHSRGAARILQNNLDRGGYDAVTAEYGIVEMARVIRLIGKQDLLITIQAIPESDRLAAALKEAKAAGAKTAAILGAASFTSAQQTDLVLFAYAQPSIDLTAIVLNAVAYAVTQGLRWRFPERFSGSDQSVLQLANRIHRFKD